MDIGLVRSKTEWVMFKADKAFDLVEPTGGNRPTIISLAIENR